jgi:4-hydroxy-4-methyl-2-oxoglutarate aldolase
MKKFTLFIMVLMLSTTVLAQQVTFTKEQIIALTPEWKGDRLPDGRPATSDKLLERLKNISLEEAWGILRNNGYNNQYEGDWMVLKPGEVLVGRALTVQYLPKRPDVDKLVREKGKADGRIGNFNSWPIDMLKPGDVYVADGYGKVIDGTLIGDNLGNSIYAKSKKTRRDLLWFSSRRGRPGKN